MTTVRLVREAEIQLRRPRLHLIPLEVRTLSPRPITLVSLQGRLPNLHRLRSPGNPQWLLDAQNATPNRLEDTQSSSVISLQVTQTERLQWCLTLFGSGCLGFVLARISLSQKLRRWVALKRQKPCTNSEQPPIYGVGGGLFIATRQPDLICPKWPWVTKELTRVSTVTFRTLMATLLGLQAKLTCPALDKIRSHCLHSKT